MWRAIRGHHLITALGALALVVGVWSSDAQACDGEEACSAAKVAGATGCGGGCDASTCGGGCGVAKGASSCGGSGGCGMAKAGGCGGGCNAAKCGGSCGVVARGSGACRTAAHLSLPREPVPR